MAVAVAVVASVALGVTVWQAHDAKPAEVASGSAHVSTATVTRTDLSNAQTMNGTLGYGKAVTVKGGKAGLVTWLPSAGATVKRGRTLYRVDDIPVPVFYGATPLYRALEARGTTGPDVKMVADNLRALGYDIGPQPTVGTWVVQHPITSDASTDASTGTSAAGKAAASASPTPTPTATTPASVQVKQGDGVFTADLIAALKRWQTHSGMPSTGVLGIGDVMALSGEVRVGAVQAQAADDATETLMTVTSTTKTVSIPVDATDVGSMSQGDKVTVTLPDNSTARGTIQAIGTSATADSSDGGGSGSSATQQLTVTASLSDTAAVRKLTSASVQVDFTAETHKGVLAVPVGALLALSEGGYAVQLPAGRLIAVKTGMFAKGLVEISGTGISAGTKVVTAS
ncbi:efflux RND transporter periplasmic adaptor subunit [Streptomyces prunicolor]|uniref:HlyD family efflux transporter periplasmic adaptor subunit n=1 Tax=Streptomyces prunicolor TaxID=67348 RepID=A0ABU4F9M6_9ACTN|nr:HlyD family efflux transporter periplasmic adaptor subunit [Streptomyces prunicolor]MDV7216795.1 HlyD family efflux transporter periplasmic adaptor subunit [Streptomyces prunicolor]